MTDVSWDTTFSADAITALAPEAVTGFNYAVAAVAQSADPRLLEVVRRRIAMILQTPEDALPAVSDIDPDRLAQLADWPSAPDYNEADRAVLTFAEQFVMDVSGIDPDFIRGELFSTLGPSILGFVHATYVMDQGSRLAAALTQLFGANPLLAATGGREIWPALELWMTSVMQLDAVDPLTAELIRLRGARFHHCRLCQSRRLVAAVSLNADLLEVEDATTSADLTDLQRAALALVDGMLNEPASIPAETLVHVRATMSPLQALQVALLVTHNACNKIAVALQGDEPKVSEGVEYFSVNADGEYAYGLPAPA